MIVEIDESKLNSELKALISQDENGAKFDVSKLKSEQDVERVLNAKRNADNELSQYKAKYKDVDLNTYRSLMQAQLEQNKDVIDSPIYKNLETRYETLNSQFESLKNDLAKRDQEIQDNELRELIRANKEIQQSAVDDIFYRAKMSGFTKTEKGFLNKEGQSIAAYIEELKPNAKHLFKQTTSVHFNQENISKSLKDNDPKGIFNNLQIIR